jgi:DNA-binding transcriptional ArsR family regulator
MRTVSKPAISSAVGALLFGKARGRLLAWLYAHPDQRFYLRQLVALTGVAQGSVQREVLLLTGAGLLTRHVEGRQVYYQANRASSIFADLQRILLKTFGAAEVIRHALAAIEDRIEIGFIYGSMAKGTAGAGSDIDLLVVGQVSFSEVVTALAPAQRELGREINPTVYPQEELRKKVRVGHHFLSSVLREPKIFVMGTEHDLGRLAKVRLADRSPNQRAGNRRSARSRRA